jgi:hypothetical protein
MPERLKCGKCQGNIRGVATYQPRPAANFEIGPVVASDDPLWTRVQKQCVDRIEMFEAEVDEVSKAMGVQSVTLGSGLALMIQANDTSESDLGSNFMRSIMDECEDLSDSAGARYRNQVAKGSSTTTNASRNHGRQIVESTARSYLLQNAKSTLMPWVMETASKIKFW